MKKLLERLLSDEGKLSMLLLEIRKFAVANKNDSLVSFIDKEINGYSAKDIPDYRKIRAEIIGDIQDLYGNIIQKGKALDFSALSTQMGIALDEAYILDGIGFIEINLSNLTGQMAAKALPLQLVKILNESFNNTNPDFNLIAASHRFAKSSVQFILTKVRQQTIIEIQKMLEDEEAILNPLPVGNSVNKSKSVFVTYAWETEEHNDKIISFVDFLRKHGYNASMDRKEAQEKTSINFNRMMIEGIQNADKVIIVLSEKYKEKADKFEGGVGMEFQIILEEIKTNDNKFIFVSFGEKEIAEITPTGILGHEILNLKNDQNNLNFNGLFAKLQSKNMIQFSDVNVSVTEVKIKEIKPFKL